MVYTIGKAGKGRLKRTLRTFVSLAKQQENSVEWSGSSILTDEPWALGQVMFELNKSGAVQENYKSKYVVYIGKN